MKTALILAMLAVPVWAQNYDEGDDPEHGVARISLLSGDVTVQRGDTGEVVAGELNAPLVALDHVLTGAGARAEVQFDYANMIRLGAVSEIRINELKDNDYFIQLAEGTATFRVLRDTKARIEISTPTVSVLPLEKGIYRITVRPDGATEVTVRDGRADIYSPSGTETLREGKTLQARGTAQNPEFMVRSALGKDDWDRWNEDRDRDLERSKSYQYVSRDIYGADDLDNHGRWVYDSPYGWVWVPNVATTWAPYRVGRWSWVNYYGWTWVSGDPWGWAPYHYGNWYSSPYGWAWYPGAVSNRYYWRPALVGFFGWGNRGVNLSIGVGFGYGNIGWVPLAPYEIYNPWYGPRYRNNTNITVVNNINIVNVYRNARQTGGRDGITSINAGNFGRGRVDNSNNVRVTTTDLARAGRVQGPVPLEASRESRRYSERAPAPEVEARVNNTRDRTFSTANVDRSRRGGGEAAVPNAPTTVVDRGQGNRPDPATRTNAGRAPATAQGTSQVENGWRRFDPGTTAPADRGADIRAIGGRRESSVVPDTSVNDNRSRRAVDPAPRVERSIPSVQTDSRARRSIDSAPQMPQVDPQARSRRESQPVQINPPIVRERAPAQSAPRQEAPSAPIRSMPRGGGDRGGPAPAPSAPSVGRERGAAPAPSAPANEGGGDRGRRR